MHSSEIKKNLLEVIANSNTPELLKEISRLMDINLGAESGIDLTQEQVDELEIAINELESGDFISHDEAKKQSAEWLTLGHYNNSFLFLPTI